MVVVGWGDAGGGDEDKGVFGDNLFQWRYIGG